MAEVAKSEVAELVRRAIRATYPTEQLEDQIEFVDAIYEGYEQGSHILRAHAPDHELLAYERWVTVHFEDRTVRFRGAGRSGKNEFFVHARIGEE